MEELTGTPAACSVTALEKAVVAVLKPYSYRKWLEQDHLFSLLVNRIIYSRLYGYIRRAAVNLSYPLEYLVLKLIKMQAEESGIDALQISKEEIANYLGTSLRSINRIIKGLQSRKILSGSRVIEIVSMDELDRVMDFHERR